MAKTKPRLKKGKRSKSPPGTKRRKDGRLIKGTASLNPKGRPPGNSYFDEFRIALSAVERNKKQTLLRRFIERAWENDKILSSVVDRMLPKLSSMQIGGGSV